MRGKFGLRFLFFLTFGAAIVGTKIHYNLKQERAEKDSKLWHARRMWEEVNRDTLATTWELDQMVEELRSKNFFVQDIPATPDKVAEMYYRDFEHRAEATEAEKLWL